MIGKPTIPDGLLMHLMQARDPALSTWYGGITAFMNHKELLCVQHNGTVIMAEYWLCLDYKSARKARCHR